MIVAMLVVVGPFLLTFDLEIEFGSCLVHVSDLQVPHGIVRAVN
jgi:hypothetical protein